MYLLKGPSAELSDAPTYTELEFVVDQSIIDAIHVAEENYSKIVRP